MIFTSHSTTEETPRVRLYNCRNELHSLIGICDTLTRSILSNDEEYYHSDVSLVNLIQDDLKVLDENLAAIQKELYPTLYNIEKEKTNEIQTITPNR